MLSLKDFIRRAASIKLYRDLLKSSAKIKDADLRLSTKQEIITQYRLNQHITDPMAIRSLLAQGARAQNQLIALTTPESTEDDEAVDRIPTESQRSHSSSNDWRSSPDNLGEGDVRGRVGTGWPWD